MIRRTGRDERGQVGGIEVLPFGLLVFIGGALIIANLWAVVDAKFATDTAARESARWVVERAGTISDQGLRDGALVVARDTLADRGRRESVHVDLAASSAGFTRCSRISVTVSVRVAALQVPFVGGFGDGFDVVATHSELVDPTRGGVDGVADCIR